jgi:hypothetical protein
VSLPPQGMDDGLPRIRPYLAAAQPAPPVPDEEPEAGGLRPFVLTSGRVRGHDPHLDLHTQVTARTVSTGGLTTEQRAIVELCAAPMSIAEISARLRLHLGVTKILVGDLRAAGYLDVHAVDTGIPNDPDTILRVIHGLRAFT